MRVTIEGFGLVIGFIELLNTQVVTALYKSLSHTVSKKPSFYFCFGTFMNDTFRFEISIDLILV
jgi:hypothetical protein